MRDMNCSIGDLFKQTKILTEALDFEIKLLTEEKDSFTNPEQKRGFEINQVIKTIQINKDLIQMYKEISKQAIMKAENARAEISEKCYMTDEISSRIDAMVKFYSMF
ncbi:unnamed protein product [Moneuplotes crassus]|uniref:Uncharacterized protein n=1 Tax=Euplotes crassus TaxID=5936 RepID=A0AAD1XMH8_EUPCR|nr:unnamed protein product [Moneuplotes crassus]